MIFDFLNLLLFLIASFGLAAIIFVVTYNLKPTVSDVEKSSTYECGFTPLSSTRQRFDIKFYLVAILFIIFDIEIAFLFPWTLVVTELSISVNAGLFFFVVLLTVGFYYEWVSGSLKWH